MTRALFRVATADGLLRFARGDSETGPDELLPADLSLDGLLAGGGADALAGVVAAPPGSPHPGPSTFDGARIVAPLENQEIWAAGVTYERSRDARMDESAAASVYDLVYDAERPELFFKAPAWRVRGPGEPIGIRADSTWDVPEPELALVIAADGAIAGFTIGNDVSSRSIEGENPLYLPQAKSYEGSCAIGPCIVPAALVTPPFAIALTVVRDGRTVAEGTTSTARVRRSFEELAGWLTRAMTFPAGAVLLTGTGVVPEPAFTLRPGDVVRIAIESLGALQNPVVRVGSGGASRRR